MIDSGMHSFQYHFKLPEGPLPGSIVMQLESFEAQVTYSVKAILQPNKESGYAPLTSSCDFLIGRTIPGLQQSINAYQTGEIAYLGIVKGRVELSLFLSKNYFTRVQPIKGTFVIDNSHCKVELCEVKCSLIMIFNYFKRGDYNTKSIVLLEQKYPKINANKVEDPQEFNFNIEKCFQSRELNPEGISIRQFLAKYAPPTHQSNLFKVKYIVKVKVSTGGGRCCSTSISLPIEVLITPPYLESGEQQRFPPPNQENPLDYQIPELNLIAQPRQPQQEYYGDFNEGVFPQKRQFALQREGPEQPLQEKMDFNPAGSYIVPPNLSGIQQFNHKAKQQQKRQQTTEQPEYTYK